MHIDQKLVSHFLKIGHFVYYCLVNLADQNEFLISQMLDQWPAAISSTVTMAVACWFKLSFTWSGVNGIKF